MTTHFRSHKSSSMVSGVPSGVSRVLDDGLIMDQWGGLPWLCTAVFNKGSVRNETQNDGLDHH